MYVIIRLRKTEVHDGYYVDSSHTPSVLHKTLQDAEIESKRLAAKHPNNYFGIFACEKAAICKVNPVEFTNL